MLPFPHPAPNLVLVFRVGSKTDQVKSLRGPKLVVSGGTRTHSQHPAWAFFAAFLNSGQPAHQSLAAELQRGASGKELCHWVLVCRRQAKKEKETSRSLPKHPTVADARV